MRLIFATIFEYPHPGGLSTHVATLSHTLAARGHEVAFATPRLQAPWRLELIARAPSVPLQLLGGDQGRVWSHRRRLALLTHALRRSEPDAKVIAEDVLAALAAQEAGRPCLLTVHGYLTREALSRRGIRPGSRGQRSFEEWERLGYLAAQRIVAVDHRIAAHIAEVSGRTDVRVQPNFVDLGWVDSLPDKGQARLALGLGSGDVVLCPRRLTAKNGVHVAVRAASLLEGTRFLLVGDGEQRQRLEHLAHELGVSQRVRFAGALPHDEMAPYFAAADAVAVPSIPVAGVEEATSIAVLEAMAAGIPVVATRIGGLRELIEDDRNGILVPPEDAGALATGIERALQEGARLAAEARRDVEMRHTATLAAEAFENDLESIG